MTQIKVDKITTYGKVSGEFQEGEYVMFDIPLTIPGGWVKSVDDDNVLVEYETLKKDIYGGDITPKVNFVTSKEREDKLITNLSHRQIDYRAPNDEEYNALNEYLKKDWDKLSDDYYENIDRNRLTIYDINDDFKIINQNECLIYQWDNGTESVSFDTYRYAYKHGIIYPYDTNEDEDECKENINGLF
jgi:hypothetical protein